MRDCIRLQVFSANPRFDSARHVLDIAALGGLRRSWSQDREDEYEECRPHDRWIVSSRISAPYIYILAMSWASLPGWYERTALVRLAVWSLFPYSTELKHLQLCKGGDIESCQWLLQLCSIPIHCAMSSNPREWWYAHRTQSETRWFMYLTVERSSILTNAECYHRKYLTDVSLLVIHWE